MAGRALGRFARNPGVARIVSALLVMDRHGDLGDGDLVH